MRPCRVCKLEHFPPCEKCIPCCYCDEECNSRQCERIES